MTVLNYLLPFNFYLNLYSNNYISNDKDRYLFYRKFIKYNSLSPNRLIYNKLNENIFSYYDSNSRDRYFNIIEYITDLKIEYMNHNNPMKKINNRYYKDNQKNEDINIKMEMIDILKRERLNYLPCYNSLKYKFKDYIKNIYKKKDDIENYKKEINYLKNNKNKRQSKYGNLIERENKIIELTKSLNMIIDHEEIEIPEKMEMEEIKIIYENDFTLSKVDKINKYLNKSKVHLNGKKDLIKYFLIDFCTNIKNFKRNNKYKEIEVQKNLYIKEYK